MRDAAPLALLLVAIAALALWIWMGKRRKERQLQEQERQFQEQERQRLERIAQRKEYLKAKYDSEVIAEKIMAREVWQQMTKEMLSDSWGDPEDIDQKVYKTKVKETWKYERIGENRYRHRVFIEDGLVVGWQDQ